MNASYLNFGLAVSLTGRYAPLGKQVLAGAQAYVNWVNATGGLRLHESNNRYQIKLHFIDDESDPSTIERHLDRLFAQHPFEILLGPYGSGLGLAAAKYAEAREMVLWNHSSSADQIFSSGFRWVVGLISPASQYLCAVLKMVEHSDIPLNKLVLVNANTGFAQDMANGVIDWSNANNVECTQFSYASGIESFNAIIKQVQNAKPDAVLGVGRVEDDIQLANALAESRVDIPTVGLVVAAIDEFKKKLKQASDGFLAPSQWEPGAQPGLNYGPTSSEFIQLYRQQTNLPIDYPAAQGFVGGLIAGRCIELAGSIDQSALRQAANGLDCTTFYGKCAIEPTTGEQIGHEILVTQWQQGEKLVVWPPAVASAKFCRREIVE